MQGPLAEPQEPRPRPQPDDGWLAPAPVREDEAGEREARVRSLVLWALGVVFLVALGLWVAVAVRQVLLLIYVSALLAIGFSPFVRWLERQAWLTSGPHALPRWAAILVLYLTILGVVGVGALIVLPTLIGQAREFAQQAPSLVESVQRWAVSRGLLAERLTMREVVQQAPVGTETVGTLLSTIWGLLGGVFGLLTILILTFYFLVEADQLFAAFIRFVPRPRRRQVRSVSREITEKVSAWLGGQLMLAGVIGMTAAVGLGLLGVPYFYVLAIIAAVGELIPYIGPLVAAVPAVAIAATVSWKLAAAVAVFFVLQQQLENYVLLPRIMQAQVGVGAATVIVALLVGGALLGVVGAILAVPTAAILQVMLHAFYPAEDA